MKTKVLLPTLAICGICISSCSDEKEKEADVKGGTVTKYVFVTQENNSGSAETPAPETPEPTTKKAPEGMTTEDAISMLQKYDIIDQFASGELVTSATSELGKEYKSNPIKAISKDLLYHYMMYKDGVEEISDYPYIDTIIDLYRRANTKQDELKSKGLARMMDDLDELNKGMSDMASSMLTGEPAQTGENVVKTTKRLPVKCLEAFANEGCTIKDAQACLGNIEKVEPMDSKLIAFVCAHIAAKSPKLIHTKDKDGRTPLRWAARYSTAEACKALIAAGADVDAKDNDGWTPLMYAARYSNSAAEICQALIAAGADVNAKANSGLTSLIAAVCNSNFTAEDCKALIAAGADVNAKDNDGWTPLMIASAYSTAEVCNVLIAAGADVKAKANNGATTLMAAAGNSNFSAEVCNVLIAAGADVNAKANNGTTPLMGAASNSAEVCKVLIAAGADVNAKEDKKGITALTSSVLAGNDDVAALLIQNGAKVDDLSLDCARTIVSSPFSVKQQIKTFPKGRHKYQEVLDILEGKTSK